MTMRRRMIWIAPLLAVSAPVLARQPSPSVEAAIHQFETGLRPGVHVEGQPQVRWTLAERMVHYKVPGVSIAVIRDGKIAWAKGYGVLQAGKPERVDTATLFSVGSLSKVATAAITLRLVDAGTLDLDRDVSAYLTRWRLPPNPFTAVRPVTLRGILSHSAGLTLSGFPDFEPGEPLPRIEDTLSGRTPSKTEPVRVATMPGTIASYSGGGTTVEQLVIEEATHGSFEVAARRQLFAPLGMTRSTFVNPLPPAWGNIAKAHDRAGKPVALPRGYEAMPELGASGLWTTPSDYARILIALIDAWRGGGKAFLSMSLARDMMTQVGPSRVGLGPFLDGFGRSRRFSHSGANDSYLAWFEGWLADGNGVVIFTNGAGGGRLRAEIRRAVAAAEHWPESRLSIDVPDVALSPEALAAFAGTYVVTPATGVNATRLSIVPASVAFRVSVDGDRLILADTRPGVPPLPLVAADPTNFIPADYPEHRVEFVRGYDGKVERFILRDGDFAVEAVRASGNDYRGTI